MGNSPQIERKIWGMVRHVFGSPTAAVSILETDLTRTGKRPFCSRHSHAQRVNRFIVQSGAIDVVEYDANGATEMARVRMNPGDMHDVEAGVVHRFEVVEPGIVVEVYFPARAGSEVRADDIMRIDRGGYFQDEAPAMGDGNSGTTDWFNEVRV